MSSSSDIKSRHSDILDREKSSIRNLDKPAPLPTMIRKELEKCARGLVERDECKTILSPLRNAFYLFEITLSFC